MNRKDIHIISRNSNWSEQGIKEAFKKDVYPDKNVWEKFLHIFFFTLGSGFIVSGIVFFFAYNWNDLHKFVKLGIIELLIIGATVYMLLSKLDLKFKNIILTVVAITVGVLIAVYGQIYQTGANAYDFFLGWVLYITLWVIISGFPPLWLVYIILMNTTFVLYTEQVSTGWSDLLIVTVLSVMNTLCLIIFHIIPFIKKNISIPVWFTNVLAIASVFLITMGIITGIFDQHQSSFYLLPVFTIVVYGAGLIYAFFIKKIFYLAIIPFSLIIICSALFVKTSDESAAIFLVIGIFIIASISLLIKFLLTIQKRWKDGA